MSPSAIALAVAGVLGAGAVIALLVGLLIGVGRLNATLSDTNDRLVTTDQRVDRIGENVDPVAQTVPSELRRIHNPIAAT